MNFHLLPSLEFRIKGANLFFFFFERQTQPHTHKGEGNEF